MSFPDLSSYPLSHPGPYERNMGETLAALLSLFREHVDDQESVAHVSELVGTPSRWSAGHAVFDEIRCRGLAAQRTGKWPSQYGFEEACCQSVYNASDPVDPFDPSSPFYVATAALRLAKNLNIPASEVVAILERCP